jgi:hypothetical protein
VPDRDADAEHSPADVDLARVVVAHDVVAVPARVLPDTDPVVETPPHTRSARTGGASCSRWNRTCPSGTATPPVIRGARLPQRYPVMSSVQMSRPEIIDYFAASASSDPSMIFFTSTSISAI